MVVFITGSGSGIGLEIARAFALEGNTIVLNGRNAQKLEAAVQALAGFDVHSICADMSDSAQVVAAFDQLYAAHGTVDVLVNNAGCDYFGLFSSMKVSQITSTIANNLLTTINTSHCAVPAMVRAKSGCIINISSIWGVSGASCEVVYSAAKAGVIGFTKALAKELGPSGVRVNAIACGAFNTDMNARLTQEERESFTSNIPLGRFGDPCEVGNLAVFLASAKAGYITGQVIGLDGGIL